MGGGSWTSSDWDSFKSRSTVDSNTGRAKTRDQIFSRSSVNPDFDPKGIAVRESVDSPDNPNSTPVIVALDVTASMGHIPEALIKDGLGRMATETLDRKPVTDPHIMFMAIGDAHSDRYPLQVTQFEADIRIAEQLKELYLEGGGGGNGIESYNLAWYFAARKTQIDSFEKRGEKGLLFTIGDEGMPTSLRASHLREYLGDSVERDISTEDLLRMVEERYDVFHLAALEGHSVEQSEQAHWKSLLGERLIPVTDYTKIPEIIVSTLEVIGGRPKADVTASWDGSTALVVRDAIDGLTEGGRSLQKRGGGSPTVWRPGNDGPGGMG